MYLTLVFFVTYFGQILTKTSRFVRKFYLKSFDKKILFRMPYVVHKSEYSAH